MKIGHTIRMLRTARKVSQGSLANQLKVTPGYLSLVEQDKREPSLAFLNRVGQYFALPVGFLLLGDPSNENAAPEYRHIVEEIKRVIIDYIVSRPPDAKTRRKKAFAR
jgi:transcriptional regulator with XRE-family HTH domain